MWLIVLCLISLLQLCLEIRKEYKKFVREVTINTRREMHRQERQRNMHNIQVERDGNNHEF